MAFLFGRRRADKLVGTDSFDLIFGRGGNDFIDARNGNNIIFGGRGNDRIEAGSGRDTVFGGRGNDLINAGGGGDRVFGGRGHDTIVFETDDASHRHNFIDGGRGKDTLKLVISAEDASNAAILHEIDAFEKFLAYGGRGNFKFQTLNLTVRNVERLKIEFDAPVNAPPEFTSATSTSVDENVIDTGYQAVAIDADGDEVTYSISGGVDADLFEIDSQTGVLFFRTAPDFENPTDVDGNNIFEVEISANDGQNVSRQTVTITLINRNDNDPLITSDALVEVSENQPETFYIATAQDADGDQVTFVISGGVDANLFEIDETTGALRFLASANFENPLDADGDNIYEVEIEVSDGFNTTTQTIQIVVTNENDNAPEITSGSVAQTTENRLSTGYILAATDADGDTLTFAIASGFDGSLFDIDLETGTLRFIEAPNFENPGNADGDNIYEVAVEASDGTNVATQTITVTVDNENDTAPDFTSDTTSIALENQTETGYQAAAVDAEGDDIAFSITGGADASQFTIDSNTGELSFVTAPDFEIPEDADADNIYEVRVEASDGLNVTSQSVTVSVTNENDNGPAFTSEAVVSVSENDAVTGYQATATDADGDTANFTIAGGDDAALFEIDNASGSLSFIEAPDFENPGDADGDNVYDVTIEASDGLNTTTQDVSVSVTNENDNGPTFTSEAVVSVSENDAVTGYQATATDADGDVVTFSIAGGADADQFEIDPITGALSFINVPDFEASADTNEDNVFAVTVEASDGLNISAQDVTVSVTNENDNSPSFASNAAVSVAENETVTGYQATATDADGDAIVFSISGGDDASLFEINPTTGVLSFIDAPDFEEPADTNGDNVFAVTIEASDSELSETQNVTIAVTDVDEAVPNTAPIITSDAVSATLENQTETGYQAVADDAEGDNVTFTISGGADAGQFIIDETTGELSFAEAPDFEAPQDEDGDNVYEVTVEASDGELSDEVVLLFRTVLRLS